MKLFELLSQLEYALIQGRLDVETGKVTNDTRTLDKGDVFVCVEGYRTDGHLLAGEAASKGAAALIVQKEIKNPEGVTIVRVEDSRCALAMMSAAYYGYPAKKLKLIGITGTKGKTTVAYMIRHLLQCAGHRTGLIGTIQTDTGLRVTGGVNTTPESWRIHEYLHEMVEAGFDSAVMEVSSQGLKFQRTAGILFDAGVFTNLGMDHIGPGEHEDFEEYKRCKAQLFRQCRVAVGNADDPACDDMFAKAACRIITYGMKRPADYRAEGLVRLKTPECFGVEFGVEGRRKLSVRMPMPGAFNVYNALAAIAVSELFGIGDPAIQEAMATVRVPGRMELAARLEDAAVFVDYAHNAMSLESILKMLREYASGRVVAVFGCGGNRSEARRYEMGEAAGKYADFTVVTTDNPRYEDPGKIMEAIREGIDRTKGACCCRMIPDRREAIRYALLHHMPGDVIVIAGKGHENYQEIRGVRCAMDDRQTVEEIAEEIRVKTCMRT